MSTTLVGEDVGGGHGWRWMFLSAFVIAADQLSKHYIVGHFGEFEVTSVLPVLDITLMHNVGAAFSLLASASGWQRWFFIALAGIVSIGLSVWLVRLPASARMLTAAGLALVLGGALGNVNDRIRDGQVTDFIDFHIAMGGREHHWPTFNVADIAICVGVGLMALDMFTSRRGDPGAQIHRSLAREPLPDADPPPPVDPPPPATSEMAAPVETKV